VECVVVGLPRHMDGEMGSQALKATAFADKLRLRADVMSGQGDHGQLGIELWDERLSTQVAERLRAEADNKGQKLRPGARRGARHHSFRARAAIDAIAAALILQGYLDSLRDEGQWRIT